MNSALIVLKYQAFKKVGIYGRAEYFSDKNKILTGNLNLGNYIYGGTIGLEFKPAKNVALSAEYRVLKCEQFIFKEKNYLTNQRDEIIFCLDVWF
jgi:Putative beta-barrel porin-2, OmpL-like. bbp2